MSSGCVHRKASVMLAGGFLLTGGGLEYAIGSLVGIFLTPDLDVDHGFEADRLIRNKMGRWAEAGWDVLWYFYRKSLKHGSALSHFPVVSTLFRLAYLYLFFLVVPYIVVSWMMPGLFDIVHELRWWNDWLAKHHRIILGLMASDTIHFFLDVLTQESKGSKSPTILGVPLASGKCK